MEPAVTEILAHEFFLDLVADYMPAEVESVDSEIEPVVRYLLFMAQLAVCKRKFMEMGTDEHLGRFYLAIEESFFAELNRTGRDYSLKPSGFVVDDEEMRELADYADIPMSQIGDVPTDLTTFLSTIHPVRQALYLQDLHFHAAPAGSPPWRAYAMLVRHVFRQMRALNLGEPFSPLSSTTLESTCRCMVHVDRAARRKAKRCLTSRNEQRRRSVN